MVSYESYFTTTETDPASHPSIFLSDFENFKKLGEGGFGTVYKAKNKLDEQEYAIKSIIFPGSAEEQEKVKREVLALANLNHPNIVRYKHAWIEDTVLDLDTDSKSEDKSFSIEFCHSSRVRGRKRKSLPSPMDTATSSKLKKMLPSESRPRGTLYIKMELCLGSTLRYWMENTEYRERQDVNKIFTDILHAVAYIHREGYIHRDLKPTNIFFTNDGNVKVGDFGLVKKVISDPENSETYEMHTSNVGTYLYMSPELVNSEPYTNKVDIYSLGIIWLELLMYFPTQMERCKFIKLARDGHVPFAFSTSFPMEAELLQLMLAEDPEDRPSADKAFIRVEEMCINNENCLFRNR